MFAYCLNNPVVFADSSGYVVETVVDVVSIVWSAIDLFVNPSWVNAGFLVWDVVSVIIPLIPGSYVVDVGKLGIQVASKIDDFVDGSKFLTGTYNKLKKMFTGIKGIEIHHLIEKRFKNLFSGKVGDFLSIPLTKELHQIITNRWRNLHKVSDLFEHFKYGSDYSEITFSMMEEAIKEVYKDMPGLLEEVLEWFRKNWKGS